MNSLLNFKKIILLGISLALWTSLAAAAPIKVAILPFQIHSDKDYTFLQKGIVEMLTSRLSAPNQVDIIDPLATTQAMGQVQGVSGDNLALMVGAKLNADFIIHGSVTALGDSVSLDTKMLDITGKRPPLTFFKQTKGMGEIIPQINLLATDINSQVFGRQPPSVAAPTAPVVTTPGPSGGAAPADIHAHPEKLLQDGQLVIDQEPGVNPLGGTGPSASPLNPAFVATEGGTSGGPQFWKSQNLAHLINGIEVGDVNHDGKQEIVVATENKVLVYQTVQNRMRQIAEIAPPRFVINLTVDVGDINGNGTPEIFITAYSTGRNTLESYILEFNGTEFKTIQTGLRWYFRIVPTPDRGLVILGQNQILGDRPSASPIVELEWNDLDFLAGKTVLPAKKANLIGLTMGDISGGGSEIVVAFDDSDKLRLWETNGKELWKSADAYGGSPVSYSLPLDQDDSGNGPRPVFLPVRIRVIDLDKDGKPEVIVPQNSDATGRKMSQRRFFTKSRVTALKWDGLGLGPAWQTRELSGRIQDICIADFDNDGTLELVAAVVSKEGSIIATTPQSAIIAYDLKIK